MHENFSLAYKREHCNYRLLWVDCPFMKYVSSRIAAYILLYCAVFFGIFVIQFTKGKTFSATAGAMYISGRYEISEQGKKTPILPVHITSNGLDFYVDEQNPLYAVCRNGHEAADQTEHKLLTIEAYTLEESRFILDCSDDVRIIFESKIEKDSQAVHINAQLPESVEKIIFPWKLTQNAGIERLAGVLLVNTGKGHFSFIGNFGLGSQAGENQAAPHLVLEKTDPAAVYKTYIPFQGLDLHAVAAMDQASVDSYNRAVAGYNTAVLTAAKAAYTSKKITEPLIAAYFAEMGQRGMLSSALKNMPAQSLAKEIKTYLTNPFYSGLQSTHNGLIGTRKSRMQRILGFIAAENAEVFEEKDILRFLVNQGKSNDIDELVRFAARVPQNSLTVKQAAGILAFWLDCLSYYPHKEILSDEVITGCEKKITDSLYLIGEALYLSEDGITVDTAAVCSVAHTLIRYGIQRESELHAVGRMLITSLLAVQDEVARIPASFTISGESGAEQTVAAGHELLASGSIYPLINPDNTWYPHEKSLGTEPGMWAWTCAQNIEVLEYTSKTLTIRVRFPRESSHYLTLHGIPGFYRIEMYGIPFRSDARFESYNSSGYAYHADTKTLFLKMRHKEEYEIVRLFFGKAPSLTAGNSVPAALPKPTLSDSSTKAIRSKENDTEAVAPAAPQPPAEPEPPLETPAAVSGETSHADTPVSTAQ